MSNSIDQALKFQQTALNLRAQRSQLLASNIANADTPRFKARDIDFKSALAQATSGRDGGTLALVTSSARHLQSPAQMLPPDTQYRTEQQSSVDGNTVNLDIERAQFAENAVQYEASITFINGRLKSLQTAITGQ
ncbi:MAG: flagellar basal body rod protein FlgB [Sterolibacteriaceae bacterium]|uniref:Flagellar basal body rod protein FlgB n=1 Tax=Candidatus Methylophosphatis roskildensis TaxID=2899263 RepID=A0A9D7HK23_9PROT|nr:flagellar basal body rod protein FlgB [Candidatus Methylophosphatis roskildensis]MBK7235889.1 flagellar basal body rod protein FlgB [Sterolibacteriaceae bacterium]